jgi:hypothetical protein
MIFRLCLPPSHPLLQIRNAYDLQEGVLGLLEQHGLDEYHTVVEVFRQGRAIFFRVEDTLAAYWVVRQRCCLKGTGITILDVLTSREATQHSALRPRYDAALAAGLRAQFTRGRLKVDGEWVSAK